MKRPAFVAIIAIGVLVALLIGIRIYQRVQRDYVVEQQDNEAIARIVGTAFAETNALKVSSLSGVVQTPATDEGLVPFLKSDKVVKQPFTVDYFVDMSSLTLADYSWDQASRTLRVRAPPVAPGKPNVDETGRTLSRTRGVFVTRGASDRLEQRIGRRAAAQTAREAAKPERMAAAREAARRAIAANLRGPLAAAGYEDVTIAVVLPGDAATGRTGERWDVSRSIEEVLAERRAAPR
ncbi:MAG: DUF4230 domain-containing protein [Sphingomicrobium sp.]